ncbi:MAG: VWA domain-containing protein [Anaerolineales bacterium]
MDLLWPWFLLLLLLLPVLVAVYIWILRRRRPPAVRFSSLSLVRAAAPPASRWRRHLPFAIFLMSLAALTVALTRPVAIVTVPTGQATIILVMDVSRSMCSTDIAPNRLEAAEAAAQTFIQRQRPGTQIGIVAFAGYAELVQAPTTDQELLQDAVSSLLTGRRTAIGSGILKGLDAIAEIDPNVPASDEELPPGTKVTPVPKGAYAPDIIVLLTDGVSNAGPTPLEAAQQAADRGVRVYTIGFGTENGSEFPMRCTGAGGGDPFGGFGGGGGGGGGFGGFRRGIDDATLKRVSTSTGAEYYEAASAGELENVFRGLPTYLIAKHEVTEISVAFAALGAILAGAAIVLAMLWHPLP